MKKNIKIRFERFVDQLGNYCYIQLNFENSSNKFVSIHEIDEKKLMI